MAHETTLGIIKARAASSPVVVEDILNRILGAHLAIHLLRTAWLSEKQIGLLWRDHVDQPYYRDIQAAAHPRVRLLAIVGEDAVARWRALMGATNPAEAAPDTIRHLFGDRNVIAHNAVHGSDSVASARRELAVAFPDEPKFWR